ncbi:hypothetical protein DMC30DRAFT_399252 [Rhodotorula diobovata]|uniref:RING-type domain-containing protein n=1 Tax=Rhodotorula diobovata TaxID=5288 RepID=A0A5C5FSL6_9BASI|nr:hypothetical protein DMC30DRAFT_399252 [Rhodotorula diobovata]
MQATDPLAHLACSSCRRPLSPPGTASSSTSLNPASLFSLAPCGHILCGPCTNALVTATHSPDAAPLCPVCGVQGHLVPLDQAPSSVQHCFRPLPDLAHELGTAAGWQTAHLAEQLDFFKAKCAEQKSTLARCGVELKKLKALKQCARVVLCMGIRPEH